MNQPQERQVVARPTLGTFRFRRNCWVRVIDGALVASDRQNRRYEFPLDGSEVAPHCQFMFMPLSEPWEHHFLDGRGQSIIIVTHSIRWDGAIAVGEAAGLQFGNGQVVPPQRADCVKLEDSTWAEMGYIQLALAAGTVLVTLGRLEIIGLFPWILVAVALMGYALAALLSGRYVIPFIPALRGNTGDRQRPVRGNRPGERNRRKRRKRRERRKRHGG